MADGFIHRVWSAAQSARNADANALADLLRATRARTLALLNDYVAALGAELRLPCQAGLNPPLWEAGHIAWFQSWWVGRNRQRTEGVHADPDHARLAPLLPHEDAWFNSSEMAHADRWALALPDVVQTKVYLQQTLEQTLQCLREEARADADALYFYRLVLFHEQMHNEAWVYMAQACDIPLGVAASGGWYDSALPTHADGGLLAKSEQLRWSDCTWTLGSDAGSGFAFDNELNPHEVLIAAGEMDAYAVTWHQYLAFVQAAGHAWPSVVSQRGGQWYRRINAQWTPLNMRDSACHLSWYDAQAYCEWAGRRLPTEAEWEMAAMTLASFNWSGTWEWTASDFMPFEGFAAHPYRDYSEPWFGTRKVLKGGSAATAAEMVHPKYRNYFTPDRCDIQAGFRTCARNTANRLSASV